MAFYLYWIVGGEVTGNTVTVKERGGVTFDISPWLKQGQTRIVSF